MSVVLIVLIVCATSIVLVSLIVGLVLVTRKLPPTLKQLAVADRRRVLEEARAAVIPHVADAYPDVRAKAIAMLREYDDKLLELANEQLEDAEEEERDAKRDSGGALP